MNKLTNLPESTYTFNDLSDPAQGSFGGTKGTFRSYFGAVGIPILDPGNGKISNITHDWANASAGLGGGLAVTVLRMEIRNYRVDIAKERLAEMALKNNCQFVFFLDDDVLPPPNTLMKMVKLWRSHPKYKVISGVYWSKSDPPVPLLFKGGLEGSYWDWTVQDLITADGAGAGCLFVDTDVFRKLPKPWFSCNYYFEDPRVKLDTERWTLLDQLGGELSKGAAANPKLVDDWTKKIKENSDKINRAANGDIDPSLMKDMRADTSTTEDLYFFKKVKEKLGLDLWIDCSIQAYHQDKGSGQIYGLQPDMPQASPRYGQKMERGKAVVVDVGAGDGKYWIQEGLPIRVDLDPSTKPDVVADVRFLPFEDCFADVVVASHILEHFSFRETVSVLKEWIRILKRKGKIIIVVPNIKWAASRLMMDKINNIEAERAMYMLYSAQKGDLKEAYTDEHHAAFTPMSLEATLKKLGLVDVKVTTTDGNVGNWEKYELKDDMGYNIIAFATKVKHEAAISLQAPFDAQEKAMMKIGDEAKPVELKSDEDKEKKTEKDKPKVKKEKKEKKPVKKPRIKLVEEA